MEHLPVYISLVFILTTALAVFLFFRAAGNSKTVLLILLAWLVIQATISLRGFYTVTDAVPPHLLLLIAPPLLLIILLFITSGGRQFLNTLNTGALTLVHLVRIPVELVLLWLSIHKAVPGIMTFEGHNFDILSGITAPLIFYFGFVKKTLPKKWILLWNFICLALLINIVITAILSAPLPFQKLAFDQPNIAILHFPFIWLPGCVVPLVLLSHLAVIRQLLMQQNKKPVPGLI